MVTEAEGAARDSLHPLQVRQVPCFPGLPLLVWKPVSVSVLRKQQGESYGRVSTARGPQCGLYQGVSWLLLARLLGTCLRARVQSPVQNLSEDTGSGPRSGSSQAPVNASSRRTRRLWPPLAPTFMHTCSHLTWFFGGGAGDEPI